MTFQTYNSQQMSLPSITFLHLTVLRYSPDKILKLKVIMARLKVKSRSHIMLHTYNKCPYQVLTSHTLRFPRYSPDKILQVKVTTARLKVKSRSHHDVAHLQLPTHVLIKSQLPTHSKMVRCTVTLHTSFAQCLNREYRTVNKARC